MPATRHAEAAQLGGMAMLTHGQKKDILIDKTAGFQCDDLSGFFLLFYVVFKAGTLGSRRTVGSHFSRAVAIVYYYLLSSIHLFIS